MLADEILRRGNPKEALASLQDQVRKNPSNPEYRTFLFQLLSVLGEWERAMNQLNVVAELDDGTLAMVQTYREALRCEALRTEIFNGERTPLLFGQPQEWVALMMQALQLSVENKIAQSQEVRNQAFEAAPTTSGTLDGAPFTWIADADSRLGPMLEAVINGQYYWVPIHQIRTINFDEPADLRDLVWMPAYFTWSNGGETVGLIPARYPDTQAHDDPLLLLGRKTEWIDAGDDLYLGLGQRMLTTDAGDYPLLDIREIKLNTAEEATDPVAEQIDTEA
ncbi:MAG: type VI secretion system accessory protein TagJ [Gammaproteobacteria bacterium]|nr:type VI secretion system accessory protein TagJ [Gammaproteobacteria bacterium]